MAFYNNVIAGAAGAGGEASAYTIKRSLRFNEEDDADLQRVPSSASSRQIWTWSGWVKRTSTTSSGEDCMFSAGVGPWTDVSFRQDQLSCFINAGTGGIGARTAAVFRDQSAWYHVVAAIDTTQSTAADRIKLYVNGVAQTTTAGSDGYPSQNATTLVNSTSTHRIGADGRTNPGIRHGDIQLAEVHFVDGAALAPTDFGEFDITTGVWNPIDPTFPAVNNGTTWSNSGSSSASLQNGNWGQVFDGTRYMYSGSGASNGPALANGSITFAPSGLKGRVVTAGVRGGSNKTYTVNGQSMTFGSGNAEVATIDLGSVQNITSVVGTSTAAGVWAQFYWIAVDGMLLVDGAQKHGKNGFYLDFADNSSDAALGTDSSGNNNTWTVNNLSATGVGVGTVGWPNKIGGAQSTYDSATTTSTVSSGTSWSTNGNNNTLHFDTQALGTHTITFTKTGGSNNIDFESSSSSNSGYSRVTNSSSTITISSTGSSQTHSYDRYVRFSGSGSGNVTFSISGTAQGTDSAGIDSLIDSPTNYNASSGNNGGNYAVLNPLEYYGGTTTFTNGNLEVAIASAGSSGPYPAVRPTINPFNQGNSKFYAEVTIGSKTSGYQSVGANTQAHNMTGSGDTFVIWRSDGLLTETGVSATRTGTGVSYATGDIIGIAYDNSTQSLYFYKNGSLVVTWVFTSIPDNFNIYTGTDSSTGTGNFTWNFGQRPFSQTVPTGYSSLCTQNLPDPLIAQGSDHFIAKKYVGSSGDKVVTTGFQPDLVWIKNRGQARWHRLADSVRGVERNIYTNAQNGEDNSNNYNHKSFDATGFTVWDTDRDTNSSDGDGYISWSWKGGSTFSNSAGSNGASIASSGTANTTSGFSIVAYQGNGSSGTVLHGLSSAPDMIWVKDRDATTHWYVYHKDLGGSSALQLNSTGGTFSPNPAGISAVSSSTFTLGGARGETNTSGDNYIAYCFSNVESYCKVGKFTGNANANGRFVYTGFKPAFLMVKGDNNYDGGGSIVNGYNWYMYDNARSTYNVTDDILAANKAFIEESNAGVDFLSNGFKMRNNAAPNANVAQYYIAFAETPFKIARAR